MLETILTILAVLVVLGLFVFVVAGVCVALALAGAAKGERGE